MPMEDELNSFILETLTRLVQINSVNPSLEEGGPGEADIALYISGVLEELGVDITTDTLAPGRLNVTGRIPGTGGGRSLMLNGHMDTVGQGGMADPFSGRVEDGRLYGRGSYDMKSGLAAMLGVAHTLRAAGTRLEGDLILSFVADEEYESLGAVAMAEAFKKGVYRADGCIVTEPTDLHVCTAHRGFAVYQLVTHGRTAHGGMHREGRDANMMMGLVLARLHEYARRLPDMQVHPLCGEASAHVPLVEGGRSLFIYSHACRIHIERRTIPGETEVSVRAELQAILDDVATAEPDFRADLELELWRSPWEIDAESDLVRTLRRASAAVGGTPDSLIGHGWWEDSAIFGEAGIPSVVMGARGGGIHQDVEWVEVDSVVHLSRVLHRAVLDYCGKVQ